MSDAYGLVQQMEPALALWLVPAAPCAAAIACVALALTRPVGRPYSPWPRRLTVAALLVAWAVLAGYAARLVRLPTDERTLFVHVWRMVRVGQLDVALDLALDPVSLPSAAAVLGLATAALAPVGTSSGHATRACASLAAAGALLAVLADGLVVAWIGWSVAGLAITADRCLTRDEAALLGRGLRVRAGDAVALLAAALLFWGAGGVWSEGEYVPDLTARFAPVVRANEPPAKVGAGANVDAEDDDRPRVAHGMGSLSLTTYPGAVVYLDDARAPLLQPGSAGEPLRAPFVRAPVDAGYHALRIHVGSGIDDYLVTHVLVAPGTDVHLTALGPTVLFRQLRDPLVVRGEQGFAPPLLVKRTAGARVVTWFALLLAVALALRASIAPFARRPSAATPYPLAPLVLVVAAYTLARLAFLYGGSTTVCSALIAGGAVSATASGVAGGLEPSADRRARYLVAAQAGLVLVAAGARAWPALVIGAPAVALALGGLGAGASARRLAALAAAAAPVVFGVVASAFEISAASTAFGPTLAGLSLVGCAAAAVGMARHAFDAGPAPPSSGAAWRLAAWASLGLVLAAGIALQARPDGLLATWLAPSLAPVAPRQAPSVSRLAVLVAAGVLVAGAFAVGRARARAEAPRVVKDAPAWLRRWVDGDVAARSAAAVAIALQRVAAAIEVWILGPAIDALAGAVRLAAAAHARADGVASDVMLGGASTRLARAFPAAHSARAHAVALGFLGAALLAALLLPWVWR